MIDRYALLGHPVEHSWSPFIHGVFARQTGRPLQYRLIDVEPADFVRVARHFFADGGNGLNITVPHKEAAAALIEQLTPRAVRAGAVNTIARVGTTDLLGDNTDGAGLLADLRHNVRLELGGKTILLLGAGGAARGVLGPLFDAGPAAICIVNRNVARAQELASRFAADGRLSACGYEQIAPGPYDLVINSTSAGLSGTRPPLPDHCLGPSTIAYDMSYGKTDTPFIRHALARGVQQTWLGWGMLVEQAAEAYLLWRGIRPQTRPVLELLRAGNTVA